MNELQKQDCTHNLNKEDIQLALSNMEKYLSVQNEKPLFIKSGMFISDATLDVLIGFAERFPLAKIKDCIETCENGYDVEIPCYECDELYVFNLSKARLVDFLHDYGCNSKKYNRLSYKELFTCPNCKEMQVERDKIDRLLKEEELKENILARAEDFIFTFLNPKNKWKTNVSTNQKFTDIQNGLFSSDLETVINYVNKMNYKDFLQTPYWKAVSEKKVRKAQYRCELCNSQGVLNVHHRTYSHKGFEALHLEDLIVLCQNCHYKFHSKLEKGV